jgi:hypothetical protein
MSWIERTAYPRLPRARFTKELRESFTPGDDEMAWARTHTQSDLHLLALGYSTGDLAYSTVANSLRAAAGS